MAVEMGEEGLFANCVLLSSHGRGVESRYGNGQEGGSNQEMASMAKIYTWVQAVVLVNERKIG